MARNNQTHLKRRQGDSTEELTLRNQEIDTPVLPIDHLERLHEFRPDIIDWILKQTETESQARRERQRTIDLYVERERRRGQYFGLFIGIGGIVGGAVVAICGHPGAGGTIASIAIGTLAVAFIGKLKN